MKISIGLRILTAVIIAAVIAIAYAGAPRREELARGSENRLNERQPPVEIMDAMGLAPGMTIADIGAGKGRFTVWFADRVGEKGLVYANEIEKDLLESIVERCDRHGFENVETILGDLDDARLPESRLDIAFMINVYHHMDKSHEMLVSIRSSLKPDGRLVIVECDPEKEPNMAGHSTPREDMIASAERAGYVFDRIETFLEMDNIYIFRVDEGGDTRAKED